MDDKARNQELRPESGFRKRAELTYAMHTRVGDFVLDKVEMTIGRSRSCDIVFESALVSRRHARLVCSDAGLFLEDLGSRNGVIVNGGLVRGSARLSVGDHIRIGPEILEVLELRSGEFDTSDRAPDSLQPCAEFSSDAPEGSILDPDGPSPANSVIPTAYDEHDDATSRADVLEMLSHSLDRLLALGRIEDAERLIGSQLRNRLDEVRQDDALGPHVLERAARLAFKLGRATRSPAWLEYVISLYSASGRLMPLAIANELYEVSGELPPMRPELLSEYVALSALNARSYTSEERAVLQRLQQLEKLAGL